MSTRRTFQGIANNLLGTFVSRNNCLDGYWGIGKLRRHALVESASEIEIPLIGYASSSDAVIEQFSVRYWNVVLSLLERAPIRAGWLKRARIVLRFGVETTPSPFTVGTRGEPFSCTVTLEDDRGRTWVADIVDRCAPHDPLMESRRIDFGP